MKITEAKAEFIQAWGTLGSSWGINRTMSQIHALLIVSKDPLSAEDIMDQLKISRGNANMNIRALMDWGLVKKQLVPGDPILNAMESLKNVEGEDEETKEFKKVISEIADFTQKVDGTLDKFIRSDRNWFYKTAIKLIR
jgi:DNA-binding MarR family transcriptional regulator